MRILVIITLALVLNGCPFASDYFYLNKLAKKSETVVGVRQNGWNKVKQINQNSFLLKSGGKVALGAEIVPRKEQRLVKKNTSVIEDLFSAPPVKTNYVERHIFDVGLKMLDGSPIYIFSRTSPARSKNSDLGVEIRIDQKTISFWEDGEFISDNDIEFKEGEVKRLIVINKGKFIKVSLDCDDMLYWETNKSISEYLLFESVGSGDWEINAVTVSNNIPAGIFKNREPIK